MTKNKIVLIDNGILMFRSIYSWRTKKEKWNSPPRQYLVSLIANLKRLNLTKDDTIIIAKDSPKGSWRKDIATEYKSNRKDIRKEQSDVPWKYWFGEFDKLLKNLEKSTPFHIIEIEKCEADDIISEACRYFKEEEIIIVSSDTDMEQLAAYPHVKIFSPISKKFKIVSNPYKILSKKIDKEKADNLLTPVLNELDFEKRNLIVNLLSLPEHISLWIQGALSSMDKNKLFDTELLSFKIAKERINGIWNKPIKINKNKNKVNQDTLF